MNVETYHPADILKPFIKYFLIIESENGMENRILPATSIVMAFRCKGKVTLDDGGTQSSLPVSGITGLQKGPRFVSYSRKAATLLVLFEEGGAAAFFKEPLHELFGINVPLDNLIDRPKLMEVEDRLAGAENNRQRIFLIEKFLLSELKEAQSDRLILSAIQKIKSVNGNVRIKDLVKTLPVSLDPFEKRFRRLVGTSPKQFSAIVRFRNLIARHSPEEDLIDAAHDAGYFDQAHFIKDFKSFTGQTPQDFFKSSYW
jgi:AraC-like DNA-binding protein